MSETNKNQLFKFDSIKNSLPLILSLAATLAMVVFLFFQGRVWWCRFGDYAPYINDAWSQHTSQHLFDPYSFHAHSARHNFLLDCRSDIFKTLAGVAIFYFDFCRSGLGKSGKHEFYH